jgi:hypothetical protein
MEKVVLGDPAWSNTFPHRVAPLADEWLVSVRLSRFWRVGEEKFGILEPGGFDG